MTTDKNFDEFFEELNDMANFKNFGEKEKEIKIDGVDVAGCGYFCEPDNECSICGMGTDGEDTFCKNCKDNPNCYYKQLKRLEFELKVTKADYEASEQENVELKAYKDVNEDFKTAWEELKAKNEQLKTKIFRLESKQTSMCEQNKELIEDNLSLSKENARLKEENEKLDKMTGIFSARLCEKYRTTLQEIKAIAEGIFIEGDMSNTYRIVNDLNKIITKAEVE